MRFGRSRLLVATGLLLALGSPAFARPQEDGLDVYPSDVTPPPGTRYPCALTALPRGLPGIKEGDRAYINRAYARILKATQAKLVLLHALEGGGLSDLEAALARYAQALGGIEARERDDAPPIGLAPFQADVLAAYALQRAFFDKAVPARRGGASMSAVYGIEEGRQASAHLIAAWGRMQARYPSWPEATRDSIYHHLCALDLF